MDHIDTLIDELLPREGGYTNDPLDRGGETCWGVTVAIARAFGYQGSMRTMPRSEAERIYRERFWLAPKFDRISAIDHALADKCFDIGVNRGPATPVKFIQRSLNALNSDNDYPALSVDGGFGKITEYALASFITKRAADGRAVMLNMVRALQTVGYIEIAEADPTQRRYEFGWQRARALL